MSIQIRKTIPEDVAGIKHVLDTSELFPSEYLDDMIAEYFSNPNTEELWFTCFENNQTLAFAYCVPEKFTNGTYNLLAIAVDKAQQGKGIGAQMMNFVEQFLKQNHKRILIVETSSDDHYKATREFYHKSGYTHEATITDFWNEGEDKIVFLKKL